MPYQISDFTREVQAALANARAAPIAEATIKTELGAISTALGLLPPTSSGRMEQQPVSALDMADITQDQMVRDVCAAINKAWDGDNGNSDIKDALDSIIRAYSYPPELIWDPIATWPSGTTEATTTDGTWRNEPVITYQWMTSGDPAVEITRATSASYQIQESDAGTDIFCAVTATNDDGAVTANTNLITVPTLPE